MPNKNLAASGRPSLDQSQRDEFLSRGVLRVPGLVPQDDAEAMAHAVWAELARRHGVLRNRPQTWTVERPAQFGDLRRRGAFAAMASPGMQALLDSFFGDRPWRAPPRWGQALVTFPAGHRTWQVPGAAWHLDVMPGQILEAWPDYVRVFTFLAPVEPGGGGTAFLAGSHHLTLWAMAQLGREARSATVREALKQESPWIAALCGPADDPARTQRLLSGRAAVRGVELAVGEMTGAPGDVVLMHPAVLHAPAPNARSTPRLMLAESIYAAR